MFPQDSDLFKRMFEKLSLPGDMLIRVVKPCLSMTMDMLSAFDRIFFAETSWFSYQRISVDKTGDTQDSQSIYYNQLISCNQSKVQISSDMLKEFKSAHIPTLRDNPRALVQLNLLNDPMTLQDPTPLADDTLKKMCSVDFGIDSGNTTPVNSARKQSANLFPTNHESSFSIEEHKMTPFEVSNNQRRQAFNMRFQAKQTYEKVSSGAIFNQITYSIMTSLIFSTHTQYKQSAREDLNSMMLTVAAKDVKTITIEDIFKILQDLRLLYKLQMNLDPRNNMTMFFSGYAIHRIKKNFKELVIQYDRKTKTATVFGKQFERIARDNLNVFHYKFSYWSPAFGKFVSSNRTLYHKDEIKWKDMDSLLEMGLFPLMVNTKKYKKEVFSMTILLTKGDRESYSKLVELLDTKLCENKATLLTSSAECKRDSIVLAGINFSTSVQFKRYDNIYLDYPVVGSYQEGSAFYFKLVWLLANSFFVHTISKCITSSIEKLNLSYQFIDRGIEKVHEELNEGPCIVYRIQPPLTADKVKDRLVKIGFLVVDELCCSVNNVLIHPASFVFVNISDTRARFNDGSLLDCSVSKYKYECIMDMIEQVFQYEVENKTPVTIDK